MLNKKKYKKIEVEKLLNDCATEYENKITQQKQLLNQLNEENKKLYAQLESYRTKDEVIGSALIKSQEIALDIEKKSNLQYSLTVEKLKAFSDRWSKYFADLKEKYPLYSSVMETVELKDKIDDIFNKDLEAKLTIDQVEALLFGEEINLNEETVFDPKKKIGEYIAATSDTGFNMNDILNPGRLELEELCKELGTMEEDD